MSSDTHRANKSDREYEKRRKAMEYRICERLNEMKTMEGGIFAVPSLGAICVVKWHSLRWDFVWLAASEIQTIEE